MSSNLKNSYKFPFEKLTVWQKALELTTKIYFITSNFPKTEIYGLSSQIQRASVSIASNIAEGSVRMSLKEQNRFYEVAYGSLMEVLNQLIIAKNIGYIDEIEYYRIRTDIEEISRMLNALNKQNNNERSE